jgi:hypothetical protein
MPEDEDTPPNGTRVNIIRAVETPLGFFVLAVLIVDGVLGILIGTALSAGVQALEIYGLLGTLIALILIVLGLAVFRPEALRGIRPSPALSPEELTGPLTEELNRTKEELGRLEEKNKELIELNEQAANKLAHLDSMRSRIWAILTGNSATLSEIFLALGITQNESEIRKATSILGSLAENGIVEADGLKGGGYYRLKQVNRG